MNKRRLHRLRNFLADNPDKFEYSTWLDDGMTHNPYISWEKRSECKTLGCVAGLACVVWDRRPLKMNYANEAKNILGLSDDEASWLFCPASEGLYSDAEFELFDTMSRDEHRRLGLTEAIARLDHLVDGRPIQEFVSPTVEKWIQYENC